MSQKYDLTPKHFILLPISCNEETLLTKHLKAGKKQLHNNSYQRIKLFSQLLLDKNKFPNYY